MRLTQFLDRACELTPHALATVCGERRRTWAQTGERIRRLAGLMARQGVRPGDPVAILAANGDRYFEFIWACFWAGAVVDPMNNRFAPPELAHCLVDSAAGVLFVDETHAALVPEIVRASGVTTVIYMEDGPAPQGWIGYEEGLAASPPLEDRGAEDEALAAIFYTGGTTGRPKGVMLSARALVFAVATALSSGVRKPGSAVFYSAPMFHLSGAMSVLIGTALAGAHIFTAKFEAGEALEIIERYRPNSLTLAPVMLKMLLEHPDFPRRDLSSLEVLVYGTAPMPETLLRAAMTALPGVGFLQGYGQTETTGSVTMLRPADHVLDGPGAVRLKSAGRPTAFARVKVADETGCELPRGQTGEVWIRTPTVMTGYLNLPAETAQVMADGWLKTGDAGAMDEDGFLFIVGRLKDMIITGGENVYAAEVENALAGHPAVAMCAVIGVPDETWGERVHAIVQLRAGADADTAALTAFCRQRIAGYKTPRSFEFAAGPLPVNAAGKLLKAELRRPHWEGRGRAV